MALIGQVKTQIRDVLPMLFEDPDLVRYLTYFKFVGVDRDQETKKSQPLFEKYEDVPGIPSYLIEETTEAPAAMDGAELESLRPVYVFRADDLPTKNSGLADLTTKDMIGDGEYNLEIVSIEPTIDLIVEIACRTARS